MSFKALDAFTICQLTPELLKGTIDFCMQPSAQAATPGMLIFMDKGVKLHRTRVISGEMTNGEKTLNKVRGD
jgi:hypothetical protein